MTHGSLFSGIGGFDQGAGLEGIETIWTCEIEEYQHKILKRDLPNATHYRDIRAVNNTRYVDIISGGFPCQDISVAGRGIGIRGERSGLWSEMFRIIREVRPKYAIIENSPALLIRGFERVLLDLSEIGYDAEWQCISNLSFGYPHKRERVYIITYPNQIGLQGNICLNGSTRPVFRKWASNFAHAYSLSKRIHEIPACSDIRNGNGLQSWSHRVGAIGNSVNVTVARYLFKCIKLHQKQFYDSK